ncbi:MULTISPECIES: hypothetical protein [unclassified Bradyrhizobium]|nr:MULTISPECIES: hypothetical protein [unclassified Bradyrhizobium]
MRRLADAFEAAIGEIVGTAPCWKRIQRLEADRNALQDQAGFLRVY